MPQPDGTIAGRFTLVDAVDHALNRGVVLVGNATISLAGVELVYLGLNLVLGSVESLRAGGAGTTPSGAVHGPAPTTGGTLAGSSSGGPSESAAGAAPSHRATSDRPLA